MDFSTPKKRTPGESIVPMINVVFLLLIFFLMTSHLAPPDPFEVTLAEAGSEQEPTAKLVLFADQNGQLAFETMRGEAAIVALAAAVEPEAAIELRADGTVEAVAIARLLRRLADAGLSQVELAVRPK